MEAFEKYVGDKLKKEFEFVRSINQVENTGDWLIAHNATKKLLILECKNWKQKYTPKAHKLKQPEQYNALKNGYCYVLACENGNHRKIMLWSLVGFSYSKEGDSTGPHHIDTIIDFIKTWRS